MHPGKHLAQSEERARQYSVVPIVQGKLENNPRLRNRHSSLVNKEDFRYKSGLLDSADKAEDKKGSNHLVSSDSAPDFGNGYDYGYNPMDEGEAAGIIEVRELGEEESVQSSVNRDPRNRNE